MDGYSRERGRQRLDCYKELWLDPKFFTSAAISNKFISKTERFVIGLLGVATVCPFWGTANSSPPGI